MASVQQQQQQQQQPVVRIQAQDDQVASQNHFYGPKGQFWPHRIIWSIIRGLWHSISNTLIGLLYCLIHPRKSIRGILFAIRHPGSTIQGILQRMKASLRRNGVFFTGTCAVCMIVLPGAGLFGKVADLSEHGRKAEALRQAQGSAPASLPVQEQQQQQQQQPNHQGLYAQSSQPAGKQPMPPPPAGTAYSNYH
jgi:hypothetical protein